VHESIGPDVGETALEFGVPCPADGTATERGPSSRLEGGPVLLTLCVLDAASIDPEGWCALDDIEWFARAGTYRSSTSVEPTPEPTIGSWSVSASATRCSSTETAK
jgi:hypothetical protein